MQKFVETNGIKLSYLDHASQSGDGETFIIMHGLTANAHCFDGLVKAGLNARMRVISVDLRGRGLSDKPAKGYTQEDHSKDLVGLLDALGIESAIVGGHSFGGLVTIYTAAHSPERVKKMIILDSGLLHPNVREIIKPSVARLENIYDNYDAFLNTIKNAPYYNGGAWWLEDMEAYYRADVEDMDDGRVRHYSKPDAIEEAAVTGLELDWPTLMEKVTQPGILLHASEPFVPGGDPVLLTEDAKRTADLLSNTAYRHVPGHHLTMLFGDNATVLAQEITDFVYAD